MKFNVKPENHKSTGVYKITNLVNGKFYVGSASSTFYLRFHQHCSDYRKHKHQSPILVKAFNKYGIDNFEFSIIEICGINECIQAEQFYLDTLKPNYNSAPIAGSLLNYRHPESAKTRTVVKGNHHCAKAVDQYTLSGDFLQIFTSMVEAAEETNIKSKTNIQRCCIGKVFSAGGFRWSYHGKSLPKRDKREGGKTKIKVSKNGKSQSFVSQVKAAEFIKSQGFSSCNQARIHRALKTKEKVYGYQIQEIK